MKAHEMTFGVEIECYMPYGSTPVGGYHAPHPVSWLPSGWGASRDGSLQSPPAAGLEGVEFVSPILRGKDGFMRVVEVIATLKAHGAQVNGSCGLHVHVGFDKHNYSAMAHLLGLVANHEKGIYASCGTKARERGTYAKPIKRYGNYDAARQRSSSDRFHILNLATGNKPTVEVRAFPGTLNSTKAVGYVGMTLGIVEQAFTRLYGNSRVANWNQRTTATVANEGKVELNRLLKALGWTGRNPKAIGFLRGETEAQRNAYLKKTVSELRRLAERYDEQA